MKLSLSAFAKVNLFLEITGKRQDHYHNICSVMTRVALCDTIFMETQDPCRERILLQCSDSTLPCGQDNLAWRAADLFMKQTGIILPVCIRIDKRIPMQAGLGGGSADAAAVLHGMNRLSGSPLTTDELCIIGKQLGADVPFCVRGGTMLCEGIGEKMTPLTPPSPHPIVIAMKPGTEVSTKDAYHLLDSRCFEPVSPRDILDALTGGDFDILCKSLFNRFTETCPSSAPLREAMLSGGASGALLSGSGAAVFGIFRTEEEAAHCASVLRSQNFFAEKTNFCIDAEQT